MSKQQIVGYTHGLIAFATRQKMETWFLCIFLLFGLVFAAITPPGWYSDETNHTYRIYQLSKGNLFSEQVVDPQSGYKAFGGEVSVGLVSLYDQTAARAPGSVGDTDRKIDQSLYRDWSKLLSHKENGATTPINFSGGAVYSPVSYLLYLPVFLVGNLLSIPFFWIVIASRLVGLVAVALAFYFAIKLIPVGKWMVFAFGLLPAVVVQSVSVGADAPQLAVTILFLALLTRLVYTKAEATWLQYGLLVVLGATLALTKLAYAPLVLLLFVLPVIKQQYRSKKHLACIGAIVFGVLLAGYIWTQLVAYIDINSNPQADFAAQKAFIVSSPHMYIQTLYNTFFTNAQTSLANIFGSFIWDSTPLPAIYSYIAAASLFCSAVVKSGRELSTRVLSSSQLRIWRASLLIVCGVCIVLIATALYVYSTTLRQTSIVGIQSRYFLPLLPFAMLVFYGNTVKNQFAVKVGIIMMSCFVLLGSVAVIYARLYQVLPLISG